MPLLVHFSLPVTVGLCPRCKSPVYEGKKNYYCSDRSCRFVMWKNDKFFESRQTAFSKKIAAALLKDGKAKVKGLYSERTGKTYDGTVLSLIHISILVNRVAALRAELYTKTAADADRAVIPQYCLCLLYTSDPYRRMGA